MQDCDREIVLSYLNNLLKSHMSRDSERSVCKWFEENSLDLIGRQVKDEWESDDRYHIPRKLERLEEDGPKPLSFSLSTIKGWLGGETHTGVVPEVVKVVCNVFHLSEEYHDVVLFWYWMENIPMLRELVTEGHFSLNSELIAASLNRTPQRFESLFTLRGELKKKGLVSSGPSMGDSRYLPSRMLRDIFSANLTTPEQIHRLILGDPEKANLTPKDFNHVEDYAIIRKILKSALEKKEKGVNLLVYGAPGTGKTEMVRTLCAEMGATLYSVSREFGERSSEERRFDLARSQAITEGAENVVLLLDEAEDVFGSRSDDSMFPFSFDLTSGSKSKFFFNFLLENNSVPVVWVSNKTRGVDPAHLRRFSYSLELENLTETQLRSLWRKKAKEYGVKLTNKKIAEYVGNYHVPVALIDRAIHNAAMTGDSRLIERTLQSYQKIVPPKKAGAVKKDPEMEIPFSTELLNTNEDLTRYADQIVKKGMTRFSFLLYGVPGSGKSAFARYLAQRLGMPVHQERASDLLGCFLGETEKNIANAFRKAKKEKAILVFDEADSFLQDRRGADHSWEIQQVNEMLTWMESFPYPFICTTNLKECIDSAAFRRFTFKVGYDYLTLDQVGKAFRHFFDREIPKPFDDLDALTPGDFATVLREAKILDITDPVELLEKLRVEQSVKGEGTKKSPIGFLPS